MALPHSSLSRFHYHSFKNSDGLLFGNARQLRSLGLTKAKSRLSKTMVTCSLQSTPPLDTNGVARYLEELAARAPQNSATAVYSNVLSLLIADLDPATAKMAIGIMGPFLSVFGFLFILRIVMSWYPKLPVSKFPYIVAYAPTEPILRITRKVIPPLGGVDVTPVVWFGLISFLNEILVGPQGLLVLLSQQIQSG